MSLNSSHFLKNLIFFSLLTGSFLNANEEEAAGCPNTTWCCLDDLQFRATLFYLKPSIDQMSYAITSTNNRFSSEVFPYGKRHHLITEYKPGFRLEILNELCGPRTLLNLRFTAFNCHPCSSTSGDFLFDTVGFPGDGAQTPEDTTYRGIARMRQNFQYYGADATINRFLFDCCPDNLSFMFGLHYSYIRVKHKFSSDGTAISGSDTFTVDNRLHQKSTFWGVGPEIGVDYNYPFQIKCQPGIFALNANARAILLASTLDTNFHYKNSHRTGPVGVNLKNATLYRVNPAATAQLGISYSCACAYLDTFIELGWEFMWYSKCVDKITGYDVGFAGDTLDVLDDLCLQGPFLRATIVF